MCELPRGVRDGVPVSVPERGGRQRRHQGSVLFSCNSGPNRVWFSFFLLSLFLYFSLLFVLSLVLPVPFPFYFCVILYSCSVSPSFSSTCFPLFFYSFPFVALTICVPPSPNFQLSCPLIPILLSRPPCPPLPHFSISAPDSLFLHLRIFCF